jgi:2-keto-3-deoxy-L-rhamnonate aldolase RhmA
MIEDMAAVERIDEIAAVEGVDLPAVGPSDLSRSLGSAAIPITRDWSRRSKGSARQSRKVPVRDWPCR